MSFVSLLRRALHRSAFSVDDIARAELDNAVFDHGKAIEHISTAAREARSSGARLLGSINRARVTTAKATAKAHVTADPLADLIRNMKSG